MAGDWLNLTNSKLWMPERKKVFTLNQIGINLSNVETHILQNIKTFSAIATKPLVLIIDNETLKTTIEKILKKRI